jgi:hypothetical protein
MSNESVTLLANGFPPLLVNAALGAVGRTGDIVANAMDWINKNQYDHWKSLTIPQRYSEITRETLTEGVDPSKSLDYHVIKYFTDKISKTEDTITMLNSNLITVTAEMNAEQNRFKRLEILTRKTGIERMIRELTWDAQHYKRRLNTWMPCDQDFYT